MGARYLERAQPSYRSSRKSSPAASAGWVASVAPGAGPSRSPSVAGTLTRSSCPASHTGEHRATSPTSPSPARAGDSRRGFSQRH